MSPGNGKPKFAGVPVVVGGEEWIVPALSLRHFREFHKKLFDIGEINSDNLPEKIGERLPIVALAVQRNYPDVTEDQLSDVLDLPTVLAVVRAIGEASGLRLAAEGEQAPGRRSTGDGSTER
jgi:hypothetical protein